MIVIDINCCEYDCDYDRSLVFMITIVTDVSSKNTVNFRVFLSFAFCTFLLVSCKAYFNFNQLLSPLCLLLCFKLEAYFSVNLNWMCYRYALCGRSFSAIWFLVSSIVDNRWYFRLTMYFLLISSDTRDPWLKQFLVFNFTSNEQINFTIIFLN